ncbi:MAG: LysM peptidoglycan-binding domain-containing protein [Anaerolineales bacterium]|nr:LysM peptidoglycan-binding domain-containing protein [Anaerolineales bacterium]
MTEKESPTNNQSFPRVLEWKLNVFGLGKNYLAVFLILALLLMLWAESALAGSIMNTDKAGGGGIYIKPATETPTPVCEGKHYIVKAGDTLYKIAATFSADWQDIVDLNNMKAPYTIYVGQELCLPGYVDKPAAQATSDQISGAYDPKKPVDFVILFSGGQEIQIQTINFPLKDMVRVRVGYTEPNWESDIRNPDWIILGDFGSLKKTETTATFLLPTDYTIYDKLWFCVHSYKRSVIGKPTITMCKHVLLTKCHDHMCWDRMIPYPLYR